MLTSARGADTKPPQKSIPPAKNGGKATPHVDVYKQARRMLTGAAAKPECVWLGRRIVSLLWRDDLDTAMSHLEIYGRFRCPPRQIQLAFRCLVLHGDGINSKVPNSLNDHVSACWLNPSAPALTQASAAGTPDATAKR